MSEARSGDTAPEEEEADLYMLGSWMERSDRAETVQYSTVQCSTGVTGLKQWPTSRYRHTTCAPTELCRIEIVRQLNQFCKLIKSIHLCLIRRCTVCTTLCYIVAIYLADSVDTDITRAEPHYCHPTSGEKGWHTWRLLFFIWSLLISQANIKKWIVKGCDHIIQSLAVNVLSKTWYYRNYNLYNQPS